MRSLSPNFERYINKRQSLDVCFSLDIHWNGGLRTYDDSSVLNEIKVDWVQNDIIPGNSFSCDISLNMEPEFFQTTRILGTEVELYLKIKNERELIGKGVIVSPVSYENKMLNFSIFSSHKNVSIGFSSSDVYETVESEGDSKLWPFIFGAVAGSPCIKIRSAVMGTLESDEGIADYTLVPRLEQVNEIACPNIIIKNDSNETEVSVDASCVEKRYSEYNKLLYSLEEQQATEHETVEILNGEQFPQNTPYEIVIQGGTFQGYFTGNTFHIQGRIHPLKTFLGEVESTALPPVEVQFVDPFSVEEGCDVEVPDEYKYYASEYADANQTISDIYDFCQQSENCWMTETKDKYLLDVETGRPDYKYVLPKLSSDYENIGLYYNVVESVNHHNLITKILSSGRTITEYFKMKIAGRFVATAGSTFSLSGAGPRFLVSLIPGSILEVLGYKTSSSSHPGRLVNIPEQYYTVYEIDYGDFTAIEIQFTKPLKQISECLGDNVYVNFVSDVGPNPVDIIEWLINNYTNLEIDSTSFEYVKSKLENYPMGFTLQKDITVFQLIKDIAYQSRCLLNIWDNTFFIHYASEEPASSLTINPSNIYGSYLISSSEVTSTTEEIFWKSTYTPRETTDPDGHRFYLKQNHEYGVVDHSTNYYCLNLQSIVKKSSLFWFIRDSTPWKMVTFKGPLTLLGLNIYDGVFFEPLNALCIVVSMAVETDGVTITLWTPIRLGEVDKYIWSYPALVAAGTKFNLNYASDTYDREPPDTYDREPPDTYDWEPPDTYDWEPSDSDDVKPYLHYHHHDYDCIDCYVGGEGYWGGNGEGNGGGYDYDDYDFDIPHGDAWGDSTEEEDVEVGANTYGRPYVPYVDDKGAEYDNPDDIETTTNDYEQSGDCWFWHYTWTVICEYPYCMQEGPCEKQECNCSNMCCRAYDSSYCDAHIFSDCQTNMSEWKRHLYEYNKPNKVCKGGSYIAGVQPRDPKNEIKSCCDLPNLMWKTPSNCKSISGQSYICADNGLEVSCDYYCRGIQSGSRTLNDGVGKTNTLIAAANEAAKTGGSSGALPGICGGSGAAVTHYLTSTGQMSFGGTTTVETEVNKTTGEIKIKTKLFPESYKEFYDNIPGAYASTAFQQALVDKFGYTEATRIFSENAYSYEVAPDGAIVYFYNGKVIFVDKSLIWMAPLFGLKPTTTLFGTSIDAISGTSTKYYVWNVDDPSSQWVVRNIPPPWANLDPDDPNYSRLRGGELSTFSNDVQTEVKNQLIDYTDTLKSPDQVSFILSNAPIQSSISSIPKPPNITTTIYENPREFDYYTRYLENPDDIRFSSALLY